MNDNIIYVCLSEQANKKTKFFVQCLFVHETNIEKKIQTWVKINRSGEKNKCFSFFPSIQFDLLPEMKRWTKKIDEEYSSKKINIDESNSNTHMAHTCPSSMIVLGGEYKNTNIFECNSFALMIFFIIISNDDRLIFLSNEWMRNKSNNNAFIVYFAPSQQNLFIVIECFFLVLGSFK